MIGIDVKLSGYDAATADDKLLLSQYLEVTRLSLASKILCDLAIRGDVENVTFRFYDVLEGVKK